MFSWIVARIPLHPAVADQVPYIAALVRLDEGPRLMTNLLGCAPDQVTADMPVEVVWDDINDEISLPKFRPVAS